MKIVSVDNLERGITYAEACFETFRVIDGCCFAWPEHRQRLAIGLAEFGLTLSDDEYESLHKAAIHSAASEGCDALVRITVTGGDAGWGLTNRAETTAVYIQTLPFVGFGEAATLSLKSWPFPLKPKRAKFTSDYAETLRALKGAKDVNVLFERDGFLIAAATANLLLYRGGKWWTPPSDAGVLPGVVRAHLINAGVVHEAECPVNWLADSEAVALCNSGIFVRPVAGITDIADYNAEHAALNELTSTLSEHAGVAKDL